MALFSSRYCDSLARVSFNGPELELPVTISKSHGKLALILQYEFEKSGIYDIKQEFFH